MGLGGSDSGAAYILRFDGTQWVEDIKLMHPEPVYPGAFGTSVAIHDGVAVVCSHRDSNPLDGRGAAYVYRYTGENWVLEDKLVANDTQLSISFGISTAIHGDVIVVGAPYDDVQYNNTGAVYVYRYNGTDWDFETRLSGSTATAQQLQGWDVAMDHDLILIGTNDNEGENWTFIFRWSGTAWVEDAALGIPGIRDLYGRSVDIRGDTAVVGSPDDGSDYYRGSAYIYQFDGNTWNEAAVLVPPDVQDDDRFGEGVAVADEQTVIVQSINHAIPGYGESTLYIYHEDGGQWAESARVAPANPDDLFGRYGTRSLSAEGDHVVAGSPKDDQFGINAGAAFYISLSCTEDLNSNGVVDQPDLGILLASYEVDAGGDIDGDGDTDQADLGLLLAAYETWCK